MKKKGAILIGLMALVLLSGLVSSVVQAAPTQSSTISVSPASIEVSQGDTFTIEIVVDPKGEEIYAVQYDLYFDNNLLNATSQTRGTFLSQDGVDTIEAVNEINNSIGKVEYGETRTGESGITNSDVLASISFEVIGTSGKSGLKLGDVILSDQNAESIETEINSGTCTVGEVAGEPAVVAITVKEAHQMLEEEPEGIILLDVGTEEEYKEEHLPDAINIPLSELESRIGELDKSKKIIVYCRSGDRSRTASGTLVQQGFENVYNMLGGIEEWKVYFSVTSLLTPTPAIPVTPSPVLSPSPSPTAAVSPLVSPEGKWGLPGFEAAFTIMGLLVISYFVLKRKKR